MPNVLIINAPETAFNDPGQDFFSGRGVDDLFWPMPLNTKFFGLTPLWTFACCDVLKYPDVENAFRRLDAHLDKFFRAVN